MRRGTKDNAANPWPKTKGRSFLRCVACSLTTRAPYVCLPLLPDSRADVLSLPCMFLPQQKLAPYVCLYACRAYATARISSHPDSRCEFVVLVSVAPSSGVFWESTSTDSLCLNPPLFFPLPFLPVVDPSLSPTPSSSPTRAVSEVAAYNLFRT